MTAKWRLVKKKKKKEWLVEFGIHQPLEDKINDRLHFQSPFTAIHVETGYRNTTGHVKVARYR